MIWILWMLACDTEECGRGDACVIAGTGLGGFDSDGQLATESRLNLPTDTLRWPDGRLVVVDYNNSRLRAVEPDGTLRSIVGNGIHEPAADGVAGEASGTEHPVTALIGPDGDVYIAEQHAGRVYAIRDGLIDHVAGDGQLQFAGDGGPALEASLWDPVGLAFDGDVLYVADDVTHRIRKIEGGVIDTVAGTEVDDTFDRPLRIAVDPGGRRLLVADSAHHQIRAMDLDSYAVTVVAGTGERGYSGDGGDALEAQLNTPSGLAVDTDGTIYVADSVNHVVRAINPNGKIDTIIARGFPGPAYDEPHPMEDSRLSYPSGLFLDGDDLYIANTMGHQIVRAGLR